MKPEMQKSLLAACGRYVRRLVAPVDDRVKALESRVVEKAEAGRDGTDGRDGADGVSPSIEAVASVALAHLEPRFADVVAPVDARLKALEAREPERGERGKDGQAGRDGVSPSPEDVATAVAAQFERRFSELTISWERQARDMAEKAIDRMPKPRDGENGKDGRDFSQPQFEYDGRRKFTIRSLVDGQSQEQSFQLPVVIDAGFFSEGKQYEQGDSVTHAGSSWIAQVDTGTKPEVGNADWRLAVKRGRDGKDRSGERT